MTLKEQINKNFIKAMKEKNSVEKNLLSVIKGEIQTVEKNIPTENLSDIEVTKILNKLVKSLNETLIQLTSIEGQADNMLKTSLELATIQSYLPKQMSELDVIQKIDELFSKGITNIGQVMKEFSLLQVDKKMVSDILKRKNINA